MITLLTVFFAALIIVCAAFLIVHARIFKLYFLAEDAAEELDSFILERMDKLVEISGDENIVSFCEAHFDLMRGELFLANEELEKILNEKNFCDVIKELTELIDEAAEGYREAALAYNEMISSGPGRIIARMFAMKPEH